MEQYKTIMPVIGEAISRIMDAVRILEIMQTKLSEAVSAQEEICNQFKDIDAARTALLAFLAGNEEEFEQRLEGQPHVNTLPIYDPTKGEGE